MALTLEDINLVKQKTQGESRKAGVQEALRSLWKHMQQLKNPDLKIKFFSGLSSADVVASDAACKLYALFFVKPAASTTAAYLKVSDHASAMQASSSVVIYLAATGGGGQSHCLVWHDGLLMNTGATIGSATAGSGTTQSNAADAPTGFAIVGAQ